MVTLRLGEIAEKLEGKILQGSPSLIFQRFNIDSRLTEPGELFFALIAERNGHDFIPSAVQRGAMGVVVSQKIISPNRDIGLIQVQDTFRALQKLAKEVLQEYPVKVIGITGSIGKTTTKEFASELLSLHFSVLKSKGNYNNQLGVPLTILELTEKHQIVLLEMAMSAPGEITALTRIAPPDVAVITNINPVHLQFFNSIEEIALAKKEILDGAMTDGTAVLNGDDPLVKKIANGWKGNKIFFGLSERTEVRARNVQKEGWRGISFELAYGQKKKKISSSFFYESHLYDLLGATAIGFALNLPFESVLERIKIFKPLPGRGNLVSLAGNIQLIDDSYNSNPVALEGALKGFSDLPSKRKIAVLGDMLELGEREVEFHLQAGKQVAQWGWNLLITVGSLGKHTAEGARASGLKTNQIISFDNSEQAAEKIDILIQEGDLVLVKGSRKIRTDKIVERLKAREK